MKKPGNFIAGQWENDFIYYLKGTHFKTAKFPEHLVMVSGNIVDFNTFANPVHHLFYNFHVTFRPIPFAELPYIDDISIEHNCFRFNCPEIR